MFPHFNLVPCPAASLVSLLRLAIPLGYAIVVSLCFGEWYHAHEALGDGIFFALLGLVVLSWVISITRKIWAWF